MTKTFCDRCERETENYTGVTIREPGGAGWGRHVCLCFTCAGYFNDWLEEYKRMRR